MTPKLQRIAANEAAGREVTDGSAVTSSRQVTHPHVRGGRVGEKDLEFSTRSKVVPIPSV
jgi:hypothetical protein